MFLRASLLTLALATAPMAAAQDAPSTNPEAAAIARGWGMLAKGDATGAAGIAGQELGRNQYSTPALILAVEAGLASGGSTGGLNTYERWLGSRTLEEAYVLRRVARKVLVESTAKGPNTRARLDALAALSADGDPAAAATLEQAAVSNGVGEARALAAQGNERAVSLLIAQLKSTPGSKAPLIEALADSGSALAVPPLRALLSDQNDVNRAAAAEALGRLGAREAIPQLRPLLKDPIFTVKLQAAGALFRLNDSSGLSILMELTGSEHSAIRLAAARQLAPQPDAAWQGMVRTLTSDPDPLVRMEAARLIAPYDQPLASSVLEALMRDGNIGIREAASTVFVERVAGDFAALRALLRSADIGVRVQAAARILALTR
jgi:HEAT repeat protein